MTETQRIKATVVRFRPQADFGFALDAEGRSFFVHIKDIVDHTALEVGDTIQLTPVEGPKGFKATNVVRIARATPPMMPVDGGAR